MTRGSLSNLMYKENRQFNLIQKLRILLQVARALEYLHDLGLIHRDVKSPNVLLDEYVNAKLCDFGITRREGSMYEKMTKIGTPLWMAPEVFMSKHYNCKADIYSLGVVMYEVMEQELPSDRLDPILIRPNQNILAKLIRQCLDISPNNRPSASEVKLVLQNAITDHCKKIVLHRNIQPTRESLFEVYEEYKRQLPW
jgi:serine/threonine protein kinase